MDNDIKDITEEKLHSIKMEQRRSAILECFKIVEIVFQEQHVTLSKRSQEDQNILGNCITVLESDIKNQMKKLI